MSLITNTSKGLYCEEGDFYIDPWKPVDRAIITHAHADHSRYGMKHYCAHHYSVPMMKHRLGADISVEGKDYQETFSMNGVKVSFHPAGHIPGSSQVRVEKNGEIWVISGDYKTDVDKVSTPFESVKCQYFVTESTFGLPVFDWEEEESIFQQINHWWNGLKAQGKVAVVFVYALGKAQRVLSGLDTSIGKIYVHKAIANTNAALKGIAQIPQVLDVDPSLTKKDYQGSMVLATPGSIGAGWLKKIGPHETASASGWMAMRGTRRRLNTDKGFVLSDHADWKGLNQAVKDSGAENVYVTHGYSSIYSKYLREQGLNAQVLETAFGEENLQE